MHNWKDNGEKIWTEFMVKRLSLQKYKNGQDSKQKTNFNAK